MLLCNRPSTRFFLSLLLEISHHFLVTSHAHQPDQPLDVGYSCLLLSVVLNLGSLPPPASISSVAEVSPPINHHSVMAAAGSTSAAQLALPTIPTVRIAPTDPSQAGLLLSPASEVIPKKLVDKIRSGRFIEMKELLQDNISLLAQLEELQGPTSIQVVGTARPRLREVSSLPTWCYCFLGFVATLTSDPTTRDQLAYARLIIKQAQSQGGLAWMDYDKAFRQQLATDPSMRWNAVNPSLLASTMLGHRSPGSPSFCTLCRAVDHTRTQCALAYLEPPATTQASFQRGPVSALRKPRFNPICFAWNKGTCPYAGRCNYRHICSTCSAHSHKALDCPQVAATSTRSTEHPRPYKS